MLVDLVSYWCSRNWETSLCDKYICLKFINANWLCQLIKTLGKYHFLFYRVLTKSWFALHVLVLSILCLLSWQWVGKFPFKSVQNYHFFHCWWSSSFKLHFCHLQILTSISNIYFSDLSYAVCMHVAEGKKSSYKSDRCVKNNSAVVCSLGC